MSDFHKLGKAVINSERVLCLQEAEHPNSMEPAIEITYDTGQIVYVEDKEPSQTIARYLEPPSSEGTM